MRQQQTKKHTILKRPVRAEFAQVLRNPLHKYSLGLNWAQTD